MQRQNIRRNNDVSHEGHRLRLTDLVEKAGIENVSNIQSVEFFLTYIFPRGDVNPLAHRLLDRYGTFGNIIDASVNDLINVDGINKRSAKKIKLFGELMYLYSSSKMTKSLSINNTGEFLDAMEELLRFHNTESLFLFAFDHGYNFIQKRRYDLKQVREVGIDPLEFYEFIYSTRLSYLAVAHNHPSGTALPSPDDHNAVQRINHLMINLSCEFFDSFIVGRDGIYSQRQESFVRIFESVDNIINFLQAKK